MHCPQHPAFQYQVLIRPDEDGYQGGDRALLCPLWSHYQTVCIFNSCVSPLSSFREQRGFFLVLILSDMMTKDFTSVAGDDLRFFLWWTLMLHLIHGYLVCQQVKGHVATVHQRLFSYVVQEAVMWPSLCSPGRGTLTCPQWSACWSSHSSGSGSLSPTFCHWLLLQLL